MKRNEASVKDVVRLYKDNGRNASIVGSMIGLSRERVRQLLDIAEDKGLMTNRRTPFDSERWFPTILKIIKSGGDIFDIVEETNLSPQRIAWCLLGMRKHRLITKKQHVSAGLSGTRIKLTNYSRGSSNHVINCLYGAIYPMRAKDMYESLPVLKHVRKQSFYAHLSYMHKIGTLDRPSTGMYRLNADFIKLLDRYRAMVQKGDLRVSKHM